MKISKPLLSMPLLLPSSEIRALIQCSNLPIPGNESIPTLFPPPFLHLRQHNMLYMPSPLMLYQILFPSFKTLATNPGTPPGSSRNSVTGVKTALKLNTTAAERGSRGLSFRAWRIVPCVGRVVVCRYSRARSTNRCPSLRFLMKVLVR